MLKHRAHAACGDAPYVQCMNQSASSLLQGIPGPPADAGHRSAPVMWSPVMQMRVTEVPLSWDSLDDGELFVLDTGLEVHYAYEGC